MINMVGNRLSICAILIFVIAIAIFIYMLIKDNKKTDKEDRTFTDNAWIGIFFLVLVVGLVVSSMSCYNYGEKHKKFDLGNRFQESDFIGTPHFR